MGKIKVMFQTTKIHQAVITPSQPGIPEPVLAGTSTTATVANIAKPPVMAMAMSKTCIAPPPKKMGGLN